MLIAGIQYTIAESARYSTVPDFPFHCSECRALAIEELKRGISMPDAPQDIQMRLLLGRMWEQLNDECKHYCLTGDGHSAALDRCSRHAATEANMAMYWCLRCNPAAQHAVFTLLDLPQESETMPSSFTFTCPGCTHEFDNRNDWANGSRIDTHGRSADYSDFMRGTSARWCRPCLNREWAWSGTENRHIRVRGDSREEVLQTGFAGVVSLAYARENFWHNPATGVWMRERPNTLVLLPYSTNPFDHFRWDSRNSANALVFGVELEMESKAAGTYPVPKLIEALAGGNVGKNFILKSDSSLIHGVELVTMPFRLEQHLDGSGVDWKTICESVKGMAKSGKGTDSCGIHIHINKKALSALTIGKMLVFLNATDMAPYIAIIAQRQNSHYARRDSTKKLTDGKVSSYNRYDLMNVSVSHPTCEVRMFKGNLRVERIYKNLEFCHALVQYARFASMQNLTQWSHFAPWLIDHRGSYPHLIQFLIDKKVDQIKELYQKRTKGTQPPILDDA